MTKYVHTNSYIYIYTRIFFVTKLIKITIIAEIQDLKYNAAL
jgi:hypothetical protein